MPPDRFDRLWSDLRIVNVRVRRRSATGGADPPAPGPSERCAWPNAYLRTRRELVQAVSARRVVLGALASRTSRRRCRARRARSCSGHAGVGSGLESEPLGCWTVDVRAVGWSNGSPSSTGAGYGLKVGVEDRDRFFERAWAEVLLDRTRALRDPEPGLSTSTRSTSPGLRAAPVAPCTWATGC